jgi:pyridoxal phosphate enzyme (YggS family)
VQTVDTLRQRYAEVKARVAEAARRAGTPVHQVILVAVSKYAPMEDLRELVALGHRDFGESQVQQLTQRAVLLQEYLGRQRSLGGTPAGSGAPREGVRWHMIGRLQRNKIRKAVELARLIHSVDSLRVAEEVQAAALRLDVTADVLLQVNVSGEGSKAGLAPASLPHFVELMGTMAHVRVRGLMAMAPHSENPEDSRQVFVRARELFDEFLRTGEAGPHFNLLSMGMSGDYHVALEEGANIVRVGTAIFGPPGPQAAGDPADDPERAE